MSNDKVQVAVRVRPFNRREIDLNTKCVVEMLDSQTVLHHPSTLDKPPESRKDPKSFTFDHCFLSLDEEDSRYSSQEKVFEALGQDLLENAFQGYNACIFAYGQTGSGKSYTMMGTQNNPGIIPRLCNALFDRIKRLKEEEPSLMCKVEVSYMEIYNEKVHDLLDPGAHKQSLKVREHSVLGPYVDGLAQLAVTSYQDIEVLMGEGNKSRTVAATNMNSESSRSHAVFNVILTQIFTDPFSDVTGEKVSKMSLVDLAGSERVSKTGAVGDRLKEGSNINKSLTTLGLVISKLADQATLKNKDKFVPYRDSVLTWLLKDNLGGNSKTVMVATISPASDNYEETLSTLRYADRAKRIVCHAVVNEDPNGRIIRELREELEFLKEQLKHAVYRDDLSEQLHQSEKLMSAMSETWEEKLVKTERVHHDRQQALEKMGISVQASGIQVEKNKFYLVNLNADPSLNELLVYYLKDRTLVGRQDADSQPDIQLSGLGIQTEHCQLLIENGQLFMEPLGVAPCFLNGSPVIARVLLRHGDRLLWGNNHFFRVNCPRPSPTSEEQVQPDFNFAREELVLKEMSNDPIQTAIARLEKQHEEDKQRALQRQRQEYERHFHQLRTSLLSPMSPSSSFSSLDLSGRSLRGGVGLGTPRSERWAQEKDEVFRRSLAQLREDIVRANALAREANVLAEELGKQTRFSVTLQIPPANLSPNRKRIGLVSEPAILVRRTGKPNQIWSLDKLDLKLVDMRDLYNEFKNVDPLNRRENPFLSPGSDPFYELQESHSLIGVANIYMDVLFHDVRLNYFVPIISQQGEVAGKLQVELSRIAGQFPTDHMCESDSGENWDEQDEDATSNGNCSTVTCRVSIHQVCGLPASLSHFVFCQYNMFGQTEAVVVPTVMSNEDEDRRNQNDVRIRFDHVKDFTVPLTEEFVDLCSEGALSIEVWGHRSGGFTAGKTAWEVEQQQLAKVRSLADKWREVSRRIELWVEIQELSDSGEYVPVEVIHRDCLSGGVYQLRQGQQRRVCVRVRPVRDSGTLPLVCETVACVEIGSVSARSKLQKQLDSYQEEDLLLLRDKWSDAVARRRQHLDQQLQRLMQKPDKTDSDVEREQSLVNQWVSLTEERNAVLIPISSSGIPGAPVPPDWNPPAGLERHVPVLFLDLNPDDLSAPYQSNLHGSFENSSFLDGLNMVDDGQFMTAAGSNSILPKEHGGQFSSLPIIRYLDNEDIGAVAAWDSSIHDSLYLNRVTEANERVYLILKATVRLSHPSPMDLILRKRLAINIYKKQSLTSILKKKIGRVDSITSSGVMYEIVSNVPKASEELEDRESLAQLAASGEDVYSEDGETYIEKYTKSVGAVESILTLDRLRQNLAVKELLQNQQGGKTSSTMRKTLSVPNLSQLLRWQEENSNGSTGKMGRSESLANFAAEILGIQGRDKNTAIGSPNSPSSEVARRSLDSTVTRPNYLNLNANAGLGRLSQSSPSPASSRLVSRMTTLHEENPTAGNHAISSLVFVDKLETTPEIMEDKNEEEAELDMIDNESRLQVHADENGPQGESVYSSGYGSNGASEVTLSSTNEDECSLRSCSVSTEETPDHPVAQPLPQPPIASAYEANQEEFEKNLTVVSTECGVVRRSKASVDKLTALKAHRSSCPTALTVNESLNLNNSYGSAHSSSSNVSIERLTATDDEETPSEVPAVTSKPSKPLPEWVTVGESILVRPYNWSGIISFIGATQFASGTWIGVTLDAPTGKHDGSVQGVCYFNCKPKHGIFEMHLCVVQKAEEMALTGIRLP
ncbi:Kinesin-like protein [Daphnia magna]|uniref:Kinesin-like protein n=1 Tax=Daphnia magna TaxID=35525 RepID=A0A164ZFP2_9CRUS|nr:Kinesin-like protein [Daphnia magna]